MAGPQFLHQLGLFPLSVQKVSTPPAPQVTQFLKGPTPPLIKVAGEEGPAITSLTESESCRDISS